MGGGGVPVEASVGDDGDDPAYDGVPGGDREPAVRGEEEPTPGYSVVRTNQGSRRVSSVAPAKTSVQPSPARASQSAAFPWTASSPSRVPLNTAGGAGSLGARQKNPPYPAPGRPLVAGLPMERSLPPRLVREKEKSSAQAAPEISLTATVRCSRSSSVPSASQLSSSTNPSGSRSFQPRWRWVPWLSSAVGP